MVLRRRALLAIVGAVALLPAKLEAQPQRLAWALDGVLSCAPLTSCTEARQCFDAGLGSACERWDDDDRYCTDAAGFQNEALCCAEDADCGSRSGVAGTCSFFRSAELGACVYPGVFDFCGVEGGALDNVLVTCLPPPIGIPGRLGFWSDGDCDLDGIPNGEDCCPCNSDPNCACPEPPPTDGGVSEDGGSSDAGAVGPGDPTDGGSGTPRDAGPGTPGDGGGAKNPRPGFRGAGGCECRTAGGSESSPLFALLLLVGFVGRARSRRAR